MNVKEKRESLGYTQSELARRMGVSLRTVQRWEAGTFKMSTAAQYMLSVMVKT